MAGAGNRYRGGRSATCAMPKLKAPSLGGRVNVSMPWLSLCAWGGTMFLCLAFFMAASLGLYVAYSWMTTHEGFNVRTVEVNGNRRLSHDHVLATSGATLGENILATSMAELSARLQADPWVESVSVRRVLPSTVRITVTERTPRFWVAHEGQLHYADAAGRLIAPVSSDRLVSLPHLTAGPGTERYLPELDARLKELEAARLPFSLADASWLGVSLADGFSMGFEQPGHAARSVSLGFDDWQDNIARLRLVWADLERRGELPGISAIKAHGDKVWVLRADSRFGGN